MDDDKTRRMCWPIEVDPGNPVVDPHDLGGRLGESFIDASEVAVQESRSSTLSGRSSCDAKFTSVG